MPERTTPFKRMQNEITSPVSGQVRRVNCQAGDQVGFGELLVEIDAGARK
jgi:biotin carboxyl carrier protein